MKTSTTTKQRIYILPTRYGFIFLAGSVTMVLIGSAYQNNLVNILAFFMLSLVFVCMIQTHNNLRDVRIEGLEIDGAFAGRDVVVTTVLQNSASTPRFNLETRLRSPRPKALYENVLPLPGQGTIKIRAAYPTEKRGVYRTRSARLSSVYPLGLFEAWTWYDAESTYYVYPEPKGDQPFPPGNDGFDTGHASRPHGGDDFHGHRRFHDGDSQRHIDWKAFARGRPKLVKEFIDGSPASIHLSWHSIEGTDAEAKLSQLARWVDEAKDRKLVFSLSIPGQNIPPGEGLAHAIRCWEALAKYEKRAS